MKLHLLAFAAIMAAGGSALAQPAPDPNVPGSVEAPPAGTLSTTRTEKSISPDGTQTQSVQTNYRNSNGVADDRSTTTVVQPPAPPPPVESSTTTSTTTTTTPP